MSTPSPAANSHPVTIEGTTWTLIRRDQSRWQVKDLNELGWFPSASQAEDALRRHLAGEDVDNAPLPECRTVTLTCDRCADAPAVGGLKGVHGHWCKPCLDAVVAERRAQDGPAARAMDLEHWPITDETNTPTAPPSPELQSPVASEEPAAPPKEEQMTPKQILDHFANTPARDESGAWRDEFKMELARFYDANKGEVRYRHLGQAFEFSKSYVCKLTNEGRKLLSRAEQVAGDFSTEIEAARAECRRLEAIIATPSAGEEELATIASAVGIAEGEARPGSVRKAVEARVSLVEWYRAELSRLVGAKATLDNLDEWLIARVGERLASDREDSHRIHALYDGARARLEGYRVELTEIVGLEWNGGPERDLDEALLDKVRDLASRLDAKWDKVNELSAINARLWTGQMEAGSSQDGAGPIELLRERIAELEGALSAALAQGAPLSGPDLTAAKLEALALLRDAERRARGTRPRAAGAWARLMEKAEAVGDPALVQAVKTAKSETVRDINTTRGLEEAQRHWADLGGEV